MKKSVYLLIFSILFSFYCSDDDDNNKTKTGDYPYLSSVVVENSSYVSCLNGLADEDDNMDKALEFGKSAFLKTDGDYVYIIDNNMQGHTGSGTGKIYRYRKNSSGELTGEKSLEMPVRSQYVIDMEIVSENMAFASLPLSGQLMVFDPSEMKIIKYIDMTEFGVNENNPNPFPGNMAVRENLLYVCLCQMVTMQPMVSVEGAYVGIYDIANDSLVKMISDDRSSMAGGTAMGEEIFVDEEGDIYLYCVAGFGCMNSSDGFLRIKSGETDFDENYFFPLKGKELDSEHGTCYYIYQADYYRDGKLYTFAMLPKFMSNPPDYEKDRMYQAVEIDLREQSVKVLPLENTTGWAACVCVAGEEVVWGMSTKNGMGYYAYRPDNGESLGLKMKTSGIPYKLLKF